MHAASRIAAAVAAALLATAAAAADAIFIAHPDAPSTQLPREDVKNILLGNRTKWEAGQVIKLAVLTEGAAHESVMQGILGRTPDQFDKFWKKQVFTGKGVMPVQFKTDAEIVGYVAANPGAFGYVTAGATLQGVKEVTLQ